MRFRGEKDLPRLDEKVNSEHQGFCSFKILCQTIGQGEIFQQTLADYISDNTIESCVVQMGSR